MVLECNMVAIEHDEQSKDWECSACGNKFYHTEFFKQQTKCPRCGYKIENFVYLVEGK